MGITGSYAGQLFGLLMGFGLAMFKTALKSGKPVPVNIFPLKSKTFLDLFVLLITLLVLVVTFIYGIAKKYSYGSKTKSGLAYILGAIYFIFLAISTYLAIKLAYFS